MEGRKGLTIAVYVLSAARVLLCMMPQNQWLTNKTPLAWGILRNIPFALLGLLVIVLFYHCLLYTSRHDELAVFLHAPPDDGEGVGQLFLCGLLLQGVHRLLDFFVSVQAFVFGSIH